MSDPRLEAGRRHLLYHLMPMRGRGVWQWNAERLLARIGLFDGIRSVAVVTERRCDLPEVVRDFFGSERIDNWLVTENDSRYREIKTWTPLWDTLRDAHADSYVFYAQGKGVTRVLNRGTTIHRWTRLLYSANLDYWPQVLEQLHRHPVVGALKKVGAAFGGSRSSWHYTGSFFWARLGAVRPHLGQYDATWWGNESWPGLHFSPSEAGLVGGAHGRAGEFDAYAMKPFLRMEETFQDWSRRQLSA